MLVVAEQVFVAETPMGLNSAFTVMSETIDVTELFESCPREEFYKGLEQMPGRTIEDILDEHDGRATIQLDIGKFTVTGRGGMGEVTIFSADPQFIDYYNATKIWPFGENASESEVEGTRYANNKSIVADAVNHWLAVSDTVEVLS